MLSKIITASINGIEIEKVTVETDFSQGLPFLSLVGLPDAMVRESKERIRSAIINSGYVFPLKRITINLSPADTRKTGSHFDLPMAVGILKSAGMFSDCVTENSAFFGELSLDGSINSIESALAMVLGLKEKGVRTVYLPAVNTSELIDIDDMDIYGIHNFTELIDHLSGLENINSFVPVVPEVRPAEQNVSHNSEMDYSDIHGQEKGKRAMQVCAAGWHDIMMTGPPGAGKTMLASRLSTIMAPPEESELIEIAKIHSIAGEPFVKLLKTGNRPFRKPHHTATPVSLIGGGYNSRPGELSLAHRGILFLDELPEFQRRVLDMLRQPLEDGYINLTRHAGRNRYPCRFILVTAMNPCPCGYFGDHKHECICNTFQRVRYMQKISGPLKDRIDIQINIDHVDFKEVVVKKTKSISSAELKKGVLTATKAQRIRFRNEAFSYNSQIPDHVLDKYCCFDQAGLDLLKALSTSTEMSARALSKIKKVARTIADLDESEAIKELHVAEAMGYRSDKKNGLLS